MPIPAGFHNVEFVYRHGDATRDCTFAIGFDDQRSTIVPATLGAAVNEAWIDTGCPGQPSAYSTEWLYLGVVDTYESESGPIRYDTPEVQAGSATLAPVPINCAVLINKVTAAGGRRNRGRIFYPPVFPNEGDISALGIIQSSDVTALQTKFANFLAELDTVQIHPVLFHQSGAQTPTPIVDLRVQPMLATQRRRMRR